MSWADTRPDRVITMSRPPSTNALWETGVGKGRVRTAKYSEWILSAGWDVRRQMAGTPIIDCRFNVVISVPISRRDTDNWTKPTLDLLEHVGVVSNDGNVNEVIIRPVERDDVMVGLWCLPDMGAVRKQAAARRVSKPWRKPRAGLGWKMPA